MNPPLDADVVVSVCAMNFHQRMRNEHGVISFRLMLDEHADDVMSLIDPVLASISVYVRVIPIGDLLP